MTLYTMGILAWVALVALGWYVAIWTVCLLGRAVAVRNFREPWPRSPMRSDANAPGVSILRPLAGLDCNLFTNLCSSFEQTYPAGRFEVIMSVRDADDQALGIARAVAARYPGVPSRIIIGDATAGVNPKVNNLVRPYAAAVHDIVWVVDSQVWLSPEALARAVDGMLMAPPVPPGRRRAHGTRVGLVHHVPLGVSPADTWGSHIERAFLSTNHAKMYLALNELAIDSCVMGKSNMYRKSDLHSVPDTFFGPDGQRYDSASEERTGVIGSHAFDGTCDGPGDVVGGAARPLARFAIYLAEDNMLAMSLWRPPLRLAHRVAPGDTAHVAVGDIRTIEAYARRRMRWIRVRRHMVPAATYLEPFTESIVAGVIGWFGLSTWVLVPLLGRGSLCTLACIAFFVCHFGLWYRVDYDVLHALRCGEPLPDAERSRFFIAWVLREVLALPIWLWAMLGGATVVWRGRRYRILADSRAAHAD